MDEEDLENLIDLKAERDRAAAAYGRAIADRRALQSRLDDLKGALENAQDELDNALCEWRHED